MGPTAFSKEALLECEKVKIKHCLSTLSALGVYDKFANSSDFETVLNPYFPQTVFEPSLLL